MSDVPAVVFDVGSTYFRAGLSGEDAPRTSFFNVVGHHKNALIPKEYYVGDEAFYKRGLLKLTNPVEHGIITNWKYFESILYHTFNEELRVAHEELPLLITESPINPKENREKMAQLLFESVGSPGLYIANQSVLSMFASGRTTGVVLESGDTRSHAVPIFDGHALPQAICTSNIGGQDLTEYLVKLVNEENDAIFKTRSDKEYARDMKEKVCRVALCEANEKEKTYELPDGYLVHLKDSYFKCCEPLFRPSIINLQTSGIHDTIRHSILKCSRDVEKVLYNNIILSGGNTMFNGLADRLRTELKCFAPSVKVIAPPERKYSSWIGGSILCSLDDMKDKWITREMYHEYGVSIVARKCPQTSYQAESQLYTKILNKHAFSDMKIN